MVPLQGSDPPVGGEDCAEIATRHTAFILRPKSMKCMICFTLKHRNEKVASWGDFFTSQILHEKRPKKQNKNKNKLRKGIKHLEQFFLVTAKPIFSVFVPEADMCPSEPKK